MKTVNLTDHFLIAMPAMTDPYFAKSLTYVCEHTEQGALGVVINKPIEMTLKMLLDQVGIEFGAEQHAEELVHFGGPVQMDRGFVLHQPLGEWMSTLAVNERVALTTSKDILEAVGRGQGPYKLLVSLGYAGWAAGQLEQELAQNAWLTVPASATVIFDLPWEQRLPAAMQLLGIDFASLADGAGHA
ncbi:MAG: hypothetical protein AUK53_04540 [Betaproteobacteria bacterium CG2_30_59_46]|nr:MAG: hypothetical protein AUK53_04540 [Betaproteobacteria bacterium CG2_30_59_46]PIQ12768.1 MAG: YqgE/AlgH family protein [Hydrogenophilales bacterium CG18_big_fil_WC_8_21_14_2_50_58_12]PIY00420.1 MAG: YqgE/AlgH family protein [Hydrogenophilales bacterium CG_4_10_14_3_um_filter_58_23]PJB06081.1 MAG: YqgE/AlgH family protein [Hydrogenophilales bacterium CG_4_9_14_3_um_filter_59_35]